MIPSGIVERFDIQMVYAVRRYDFMLALGFPCQVVSLGYERGGIAIHCRDIFNNATHQVHIKTCVPLFTFVPEYRNHTALLIDRYEVLTDLDDIVTTRAAVAVGDRLQTVAAPVCIAGEWVANRVLKKIISGGVPAPTPE